jgi:hypothetical protein
VDNFSHIYGNINENKHLPDLVRLLNVSAHNRVKVIHRHTMQRHRVTVCTRLHGCARHETRRNPTETGPVNGPKGRPIRARFQIRARQASKGPAGMAGREVAGCK